jgi:hypothetical protein
MLFLVFETFEYTNVILDDKGRSTIHSVIVPMKRKRRRNSRPLGEEIAASRKKREQLEAVGLSRKPIDDAFEVQQEAMEEFEAAGIIEDAKRREFDFFMPVYTTPSEDPSHTEQVKKYLRVWELLSSSMRTRIVVCLSPICAPSDMLSSPTAYQARNTSISKTRKILMSCGRRSVKLSAYSFQNFLRNNRILAPAREYLMNFNSDDWLTLPASNHDTDSDDDANDGGSINEGSQQSESQDQGGEDRDDASDVHLS